MVIQGGQLAHQPGGQKWGKLKEIRIIDKKFEQQLGKWNLPTLQRYAKNATAIWQIIFIWWSFDDDDAPFLEWRGSM